MLEVEEMSEIARGTISHASAKDGSAISEHAQKSKIFDISKMEKKRSTSVFEKLLLVVGFLLLIMGYFFINKVFAAEGYRVSWGFLQTVFLWLLMVIFIIMLAIGEDIKEGILLQQLDEIRELKEQILKKRK